MEPNPDMILTAPAGAPWVLHAGAALLLFLHIAGGSVGLVAGATAILARKGERLHRAAGTVFFVSMLFMAGVGAGVSPFLPDAQWTNTTAGLFTLYLVGTSWATVRRGEGRVGRFEVGAFLVAAGIAVTGLALAVLHAGTPEAGGFATVYAFAVVAAIAAAGDFRMIRRGGISGAPRIARHLWRMSLALFIAAGSFFFGQADEIPQALQGPHLMVPPLAVLGLLVFWMLRVRFTSAFKGVAA
jgi:uncharacterized membrane protein